MAARDIEIFLAEHYGALTGEAGRGFLEKSMAAARTTRAALEQTYADTGGDVEKTVEKITEHMISGAPTDFLPREVMALVAGQMVRFNFQDGGPLMEKAKRKTGPSRSRHAGVRPLRV